MARGYMAEPDRALYIIILRKEDTIMYEGEKEKQLRIFVSCVNSIVGQAIVENIRNDNYNDENPHLIIGTLDREDSTPACRGVKRIISVGSSYCRRKTQRCS